MFYLQVAYLQSYFIVLTSLIKPMFTFARFRIHPRRYAMEVSLLYSLMSPSETIVRLCVYVQYYEKAYGHFPLD